MIEAAQNISIDECKDECTEIININIDDVIANYPHSVKITLLCYIKSSCKLLLALIEAIRIGTYPHLYAELMDRTTKQMLHFSYEGHEYHLIILFRGKELGTFLFLIDEEIKGVNELKNLLTVIDKGIEAERGDKNEKG